jgi:hypothetical protein
MRDCSCCCQSHDDGKGMDVVEAEGDGVLISVFVREAVSYI